MKKKNNKNDNRNPINSENTNSTKSTKGSKYKKSETRYHRRFWISLYALYMIIIIITASAYFAEQSVNTRQGGTYSYSLTFSEDGKIEHYTVKLVDKSEPGYVWVTYNKNGHELDVKTQNILDLTIDCRSIAKEKTREILGYDYLDHENDYKDYFIQKNLFIISVNTDHRISLTMEDIPHPTKVKVNDEIEEFSYVNGKIIATVPEGNSEVEISFEKTGLDLIAHFVTNNKNYYHSPNIEIDFDASGSSPKEKIVDYLWDFGDGIFGDGEEVKHTYTAPGKYTVVLVIRDGQGRLNRASGVLFVYDEDNDNLPDFWEDRYFYNYDQDGSGDPDGDGLSNIDEYGYNTIPNVDDSDNDGFTDGYEIEKNSDPLDPNIKPKEAATTPDDADYFIIMVLVIIVIIIVIIGSIIIRSKQKRTKDRELELEQEGELSDDVGYVAGDAVTEGDFDEPYECPECGSEIEEDQKMCYECGAVLEWEEEEDFDGEYESDITSRDEDDEEIFEEDEDDEEYFEEDDDDFDVGAEGDYECPTCGESVKEDDLVCPICGEEFE